MALCFGFFKTKKYRYKRKITIGGAFRPAFSDIYIFYKFFWRESQNFEISFLATLTFLVFIIINIFALNKKRGVKIGAITISVEREGVQQYSVGKNNIRNLISKIFLNQFCSYNINEKNIFFVSSF